MKRAVIPEICSCAFGSYKTIKKILFVVVTLSLHWHSFWLALRLQGIQRGCQVYHINLKNLG